MYTPINKGFIVVIGVLVVALIVMAAAIGYLYGFNPATGTQTVTLTDIGTYTLTKTQTQLKTATETETTTETLIQSVTLTQTQTQIQTQTTTKTSTTTQTMTKTVTPAYEKLVIISAYNNYTTSITINVKNNGTADSTIAFIFVNGKPLDSNKIKPSIPFVLKVGTSVQLQLDFTMASLIYGETYDFRIRTGSGADYAVALRII